MTLKVEVTSGSVKWKATGKDDEGKVLEQGEVVTMEPLGETRETKGGEEGDVGELLKQKAAEQREEDVAAPTVGSASTREGLAEGEFRVTNEGAEPVTVRVYRGNDFVDHKVEQGSPLTLTTTESNAVTAAFYGVKAV